ncbi:uncharacterized protein LOC124289380 [Haliotis rubra]|uniref:uncharacterized protein LOC124289380 n=1 Tax=Haliotis rubra TaxID=36100 RepID=UPI001EE5F1DA|nr:uncharacterized protein LOC124289380 [Haliotis rubra]
MAMVHTWNDSESVRFLTERMDSYRFLKVFIAILCVVLCCGEHRMQESGNLVSDMSQSSLRCLVYDLNTTDTARTLLELHQTMFPEVNVVVVMKQVHVQQLMKTVNSFDEMTKGQTDFQHHSKWLLVIEDLKLTDLRGYIALENVALILPLSKRILHTVLTVRHHPGQNVFVPVEPCVARDYISCLYPNTAYGYNNRHLRVTTLESNRFISKYVLNATTRHEGYAIEILDIITQALNLSYSITEPEDGAWGLPVNGTYSGIVGQLYRRPARYAA